MRRGESSLGKLNSAFVVDANTTAAFRAVFEILGGMCLSTVLDTSWTRAVRAAAAFWLSIGDGSASGLNGRERGRGDGRPR